MTLKAARARCVALLRACEESLPITRGAFLSHTGSPLGIPYEEVRAFLEVAPQAGNLEREQPNILWCRGEIVQTIDALRAQLGGAPADSLRTAEAL